MTSLRELLTSPSWWVSVVLVGLLINIISAYLKKFSDRALSKFSKSWRARVARRAEVRIQTINRLKSDSQAFNASLLTEIRARVQALQFVVFGSIFFGMANYFAAKSKPAAIVTTLFILSVISITLSMLTHFEALKEQSLQDESTSDNKSNL